MVQNACPLLSLNAATSFLDPHERILSGILPNLNEIGEIKLTTRHDLILNKKENGHFLDPRLMWQVHCHYMHPASPASAACRGESLNK